MHPIVNLLEEDRATAIGNMHKNLLKIARGVPEISCRTDRQTHRQTHSSQHLATAVAGKVATGWQEQKGIKVCCSNYPETNK